MNKKQASVLITILVVGLLGACLLADHGHPILAVCAALGSFLYFTYKT